MMRWKSGRDNSYFPGLDPELQPYLARDALHGLNALLGQLSPGAMLESEALRGITLLIELAGPPVPPNDNEA